MTDVCDSVLELLPPAWGPGWSCHGSCGWSFLCPSPSVSLVSDHLHYKCELGDAFLESVLAWAAELMNAVKELVEAFATGAKYQYEKK